MQDPDRLNDQTTYQRCYACGARNPAGLQMTFRRHGDRIVAEFEPGERHQGFPGVLHGGIIATLLDETMERTGALRREWLVTGKLDVRYRRPAPIGQRLHIWGEIARERPGAVEASGAIQLEDGTVVAEGRGLFLSLPRNLQAESAARYPDFVNYWTS